MTIGKNIQTTREKLGLTLEDMAGLLSLSAADYSRIETGENEPTVSEMLKIAGLLRTDIFALISGHQYNEKPTIITRKVDRLRAERRGKLGYETLAPNAASKHMEPFVIEVFEQPEDRIETSTHSGEEFHYVLEGTLRIQIAEDVYDLNAGDSIYFDSSEPHKLTGLGGTARVLAVIYNSDSMIRSTKSKKMRDLIKAAQLTEKRNVAVVWPDKTAISALFKALEEDVIGMAYLVGNTEEAQELVCAYGYFAERIEFVEIGGSDETQCPNAAAVAVELVKSGKAHMLMKGNINTAMFTRAVLHPEDGVGTGRRLSLVSIFEIPTVERLVFLTDPGINPALVRGDDLDTAKDIIQNGIHVAHALGIARPKVALLDANEVPSKSIPTTLHEQELTTMHWGEADVFGPLSYDLALYPEAVKKKGITGNPVAGKADIIVVPHISGGNFLYKTWVMTVGAEVANIVAGAQVPIILTSRSDSEMTKFLTICASTLYAASQQS